LRRVHALIAVGVLALAASGVAQAVPAKHGAAATVTVTITDRTLRVSPTNPESGATKFVVVNKGKKRHFFVISGPGVKDVRTAKIAPGARTTLTVKLRPGAYVLSDPIGLGTYTSAFLDVIKSSTLTGGGNTNKVQPEVQPPEMCGVYFSP
jgi:hypothetical protein